MDAKWDKEERTSDIKYTRVMEGYCIEIYYYPCEKVAIAYIDDEQVSKNDCSSPASALDDIKTWFNQEIDEIQGTLQKL